MMTANFTPADAGITAAAELERMNESNIRALGGIRAADLAETIDGIFGDRPSLRPCFSLNNHVRPDAILLNVL